MGKSDPYFSIEYGDYKESSMTLNNAGNEVVWRDVNMIIEVNENNLRNDRMRVCVHDENTSCRDTVLGTGYADVMPLCAAVGEERKIEVILSDEKGAKCGTALMMIVLEPSRVQVSARMLDWVICSPFYLLSLHDDTHLHSQLFTLCLSVTMLAYSYMSPYRTVPYRTVLMHVRLCTYSYISYLSYFSRYCRMQGRLYRIAQLR